jgi:hypothetical protein
MTGRKWAAIVAGALLLAYVGTVTTTKVQEVASWQADGLWFAIAAVICGALVFVSTDGDFWSIVGAALFAALIVAIVGFYIHWVFLGEYFTVFELVLSNVFFLQVLPQSGIVFMIAALLGLVGGLAVAIFFPEHFPL